MAKQSRYSIDTIAEVLIENLGKMESVAGRMEKASERFSNSKRPIGRNLANLLKDEEPSIYKSQRKKKIEVEIFESDIITLINSIPIVQAFDTEEFETAEILLDLIERLRQEWNKA